MNIENDITHEYRLMKVLYRLDLANAADKSCFEFLHFQQLMAYQSLTIPTIYMSPRHFAIVRGLSD